MHEGLWQQFKVMKSFFKGTEKLIMIFEGHSKSVISVVFSRNGLRIASEFL